MKKKTTTVTKKKHFEWKPDSFFRLFLLLGRRKLLIITRHHVRCDPFRHRRRNRVRKWHLFLSSEWMEKENTSFAFFFLFYRILEKNIRISKTDMSNIMNLTLSARSSLRFLNISHPIILWYWDAFKRFLFKFYIHVWYNMPVNY